MWGEERSGSLAELARSAAFSASTAARVAPLGGRSALSATDSSPKELSRRDEPERDMLRLGTSSDGPAGAGMAPTSFSDTRGNLSGLYSDSCTTCPRLVSDEWCALAGLKGIGRGR